MLEQGQIVSGYTVVQRLYDNKTCQGFLVTSDRGEAKLLLVDSSLEWNRSQRQKFHDQVKKLAAVSLPAACCLPVTSAEEQGRVFCVYPLPAGSPFHAALTEDVSARAVLELIRDIAACLESAHAAGLVHGNLSPQTVYTEAGGVCLADFALASLLPPDYQCGVDPGYASPEQVRGESPDSASDIYSLGCLFYFLLMKTPPFAAGDAFAVGLQHLNGHFPELPEPLAPCRPLLRGMTAKGGDERLTAHQVRDAASLLLEQDVLDRTSYAPTAVGAVNDVKADRHEQSFTQAAEAAMVARIEARLQQFETASLSAHLADETPLQPEEIALAPPPAREKKSTGSMPRALLFAVGLMVGFCLGVLSFDLFLVRKGVEDPLHAESLPPARADLDPAIQLWKASDLKGAEKEFTRLLAEFPGDFYLLNNLAAIHAAQGEIESARDSLERAMVLNDDFAALYRNLGTVYAEMARDSYGRALQMNTPPAVLHLDLFTNQGVLSWPVAPQPLVAATVASMSRDVAATSAAVIPVVAPAAADAAKGADPDSRATLTAAPDKEQAVAETVVVAAVDRPVAEPDSGPTVTTPPVAGEDVVEFLQRWAAAWSAQDIEGYLSFYGADFLPAAGISRDDWEAQRRDRLARPENIHVILEGFELRQAGADLIRIEVVQGYRSDRYADTTRKLFDLQATEQGWKIQRERSLELLR